jgi:phosphomannomutase
MIPWLLVAAIMSRRDCPLSELVNERVAKFPASGEINRTVADAKAAIENIEHKFSGAAVKIEHVDGLSMEFPDWRFNLRMSNTEPLVRLNVESRGDIALMHAKTDELLKMIGGEPG